MVGPTSIRAGDVLGGRYEIAEQIGSGGHGVVFRAVQKPLARDVAIKVMLPTDADGATERFGREVALVQRLEHPNTVRLYDFGTTEDGLPFMVFELLRGRSLEQEIAEGPMPPARVAAIAVQILKSLMEAHALGIVHRDVKPSNVMLVTYSGEEDFVKVLDFGVARSYRTKGGSITREGQIVGSAPYMSPEQVRSDRVDPRADVYALGLVLAEALAGVPVYEGPSEVHIWLMQASPEDPPIPALAAASSLGPVIARATKKDPAQRYQTASEMLTDLEQVENLIEKEAVPSTDPAPGMQTLPAPPKKIIPTRPIAPQKRSRAPIAIAAATAAIVLGTFALLHMGRVQRTVAPATARPPKWFAEWESRIAMTEWKRTGSRTSEGAHGEELVVDLERGHEHATVTLRNFPEHEESVAGAVARDEMHDRNTAVFRDGVHVAVVRADNRDAARELLREIDSPRRR
jgi:serine/threonine protein kinase